MAAKLQVSVDAVRTLQEIQTTYGEIVLHDSHVSGGPSSPTCYPAQEFAQGSADVLLGTVGGVPFYVSAARGACLSDKTLLLDVIEEPGNPLFLEGRCGVRFVTRVADTQDRSPAGQPGQ